MVTRPISGQAIDPFTTANRIYLSHISGRPSSFILPSSDPYMDPTDESRLIYKLKLTLLPNQILILPNSLEKRLNQDIFKTFSLYTDSDVRYVL